jgi:hypothetical protein
LPQNIAQDWTWANLWPCPNYNGVEQGYFYEPVWWCGTGDICNKTTTDTSPESNSFFTIPLDQGLDVAAILPNGTLTAGCNNVGQTYNATKATVTVTAGTAASSSSHVNGTSSVHQSSSFPAGAIAGLVVLGVTTLLSAGWAVWEHRLRKNHQRRQSPDMASGHRTFHMATHETKPGADYYSKPAEMEGHSVGPEMDGRAIRH